MRTKTLIPGDGYIYEFFWGHKDEGYLIGVISGRFNTAFFFNPSYLEKDPLVLQGQLRDTLDITPEMAMVIWSFLNEEFNSPKLNSTSLINFFKQRKVKSNKINESNREEGE